MVSLMRSKSRISDIFEFPILRSFIYLGNVFILFLEELIDKNNENNKLKSFFDYSYEAKMIIQHALKDLKNKTYN